MINIKMKKKQILILMLSVVAFLIVAILGIFLANYSNAKKISKEWNDKIYPGVTVDQVDLSGKTIEEARELILSQCTEELLDKELKIVVENRSFDYKYSEILAEYNVDKSLKEAINYGKDLGVFQQKKLIKNKKNKKVHIELDFSYDEEKISEIEKDIESKVNIESKNAILHFNGGAFTITPEVVGCELKTEDINEKIKNVISGELGKESVVSLELATKTPSITEVQLSRITGQMSYYETLFNKGYDTGRDYNLSIASAQVNGTLLMPGEVFSYAKKTQAVEDKYVDAMVIGADNQYVPGNAGGICQVSTTLYNAVMRANIRSTERYNHSIASGYVPVGLDATVAWGYLDYKFTNTYDFPIYIYAATVGNKVQIAVYGDPSAMGGKTYSMTSEVEVRQAENKQIAKSYLLTYENGIEVNREYIDTSTYILDNTPADKKNNEKQPEPEEKTPEENKPEEESEPEQGKSETSTPENTNDSEKED